MKKALPRPRLSAVSSVLPDMENARIKCQKSAAKEPQSESALTDCFLASDCRARLALPDVFGCFRRLDGARKCEGTTG